MKITINRPVTEEVAYVRIGVDVKCDEEYMPNDFPGRTFDLWCVRIAINNGDLWLENGFRFPVEIKHSLYMKVTDAGSYALLNHACERIVKSQGYVPGFFPGEHYGNYIIFEIEAGRVTNWKANRSKVQSWAQSAIDSQIREA